MAKRSFTDKQIDKLTKDGPGGPTYPVPQLRGLYVRVTNVNRIFYVAARDLNRKQVWVNIGDRTTMSVAEAVEKAPLALKAIKEGADAKDALDGPPTFKKVAEQWFENHVNDAERTLRSAKLVRGNLNNHLYPALGAREFETIDRGDIVKLLDKVKKNTGSTAADKVLNITQRICNWYAVRHPKYATPVVRGMRVISTKERARDRILTDDELRAIWKTAEANGQFGAFIRLLLLTGQRREKVAAMKWSEIEDGVWTIPADKREKGNAGEIKLPQAALDILAGISHVDGNPYVFAAARGKIVEQGKKPEPTHFSGYSKMKKAFDKKAGITDWRLHDLRRTARSLLSRAGVSSEHAERVLGHAIRGVEGVYDRHRYEQEIAVAVAKLAGLIDLIANPPADNVRRIAG